MFMYIYSKINSIYAQPGNGEGISLSIIFISLLMNLLSIYLILIRFFNPLKTNSLIIFVSTISIVIMIFLYVHLNKLMDQNSNPTELVPNKYKNIGINIYLIFTCIFTFYVSYNHVINLNK